MPRTHNTFISATGYGPWPQTLIPAFSLVFYVLIIHWSNHLIKGSLQFPVCIIPCHHDLVSVHSVIVCCNVHFHFRFHVRIHPILCPIDWSALRRPVPRF